MSAITVRANMRMMFDHSSANKMQTDYMGRLSKLEKGAMESTKKSNRQLAQDHSRYIKQLEAQNAAADAKLKEQSKKITKQVSANAAAAMTALDPGKYKKGGTKAQYNEFRRQKSEYKATIDSMRMANEKYAASAKKLGIQAKGGAFSLGTFTQNEHAMRKQGIVLMKRQVAEMKKGSAEQKASLFILKQMEDSHELITQEERMRGTVIRQNNGLMRQSQMSMNRGIAANNAKFREQMAILAKINGSISRLTMQLQGAFMGALMASGIALMTFGFRLMAVTDTFKEFEKELMNAQSIFQTTDDILFSLSDEIVNFGTEYGISLGTASEGLYTLASAGLSAADSQEVLANTLKLSMAVQGDHDTIAKLTTQTIFGFGLDMDKSAELTDKFAHAINMSLIEYQDLASAVKFAMPFFITTGQNIDQLLGSLQILTNRALEAGIAGRGLRQALSEFAQHAEDNTAAFAKLGVKVTDANGNFLMLTEIAKNFQTQFSHMSNDTELLTTLLEDLNVRGATAFVHLVQNADEFQAAVDDLANSAGSATRMADIQQQSLSNQIQVVKNALMAPFLLSDEVGKANGKMNTFAVMLHAMVEDFEAFFLKTAPDGTKVLSEMGAQIRDTVIAVLQELSSLMKDLLVMFANMSKEGSGLTGIFTALMVPLRLLVKAINILGPGGLQAVMMFKAMNAILPFTELHTLANTLAMLGMAEATAFTTKMGMALIGAQMALNIGLIAGLMLLNSEEESMRKLGTAILFAAGAYAAYAIAKAAGVSAIAGPAGLAAATLAGGALTAGLGHGMKKVMTPPDLVVPKLQMADTGMRMYDTGGLGGRHFPVMVEPGETITSKTQNMLGGGGITLNIGGDIITNDADDFAERIAVALPEALRKQNEIGGL